MGTFTERVQAGRIPGPLRSSFTPARWNSAFKATGAQDERDQHIYEAALVIHSKLESIRSRLKLSTSSSLSATTKLRACVAGANHNFFAVRTKTHSAFKEALDKWNATDLDGFWPEQLEAEVKLKLLGGFEWSPNEVFESIVDGIEVPVRFALQGSPSLAGNPSMNQVEWSDIVLELNLGVMFRHAEDVWDDCLWNSYKMTVADDMRFFTPQEPDVVKSFVVGHARRLSLAVGSMVSLKKFYRGWIARGLMPRLREVIAIEQVGKRQVLKVSKRREQTSTQEDLFVMLSYAGEPYYEELLGEASPAAGGLTLSSVLDAWTVISRSALVLVENLSSKDEQIDPLRPAHTWLPEYAPVLQVDALIQALTSAANIKPADGKRLIEFFTFRGTPGQEIWASPLVPVGTKTVTPVFAAVVSPNLRRLVDVWMRQLGIDLGKRGPAFEAYLRESVVESISSSKILAGHAACINESYTFKPSGGKEEEIDLLFVIGSTVFLGEAKCLLEPTEAKAIAMHRRTVIGAAEQANRKAQSLIDNRAEFIEDIRRFGVVLSEDFAVLKFVVVSGATHVGIPANGVPVIDEYILQKFLEGELEDFAVAGNDLEIQKRVKTIFYTDLADAQLIASEYFAKPPQIQRLLKGIVARAVPMHAIDDTDWTGVVMTLGCEPSRGGLAI